MKKFKFDKSKVTAVCIGTFLAGVVFSCTAFASELDVKVTEQFKEWNKLTAKEKQESLLPPTYSTEIPEDILKKYATEKRVPNLVSNLLGNFKLGDSLGAVSDSKYNIADKLELRVENQGVTSECWAFSMIKSMETNIALKSGTKELQNFSERHMNYATSRTFKDGVNKRGYKREVTEGGLPISALAYLTNGEGAVFEKDMPFENNMDKIELSKIEKNVDTVVTEYNTLPNIYKSYEKDENGNTKNVTYTDASGVVYSEVELKAIRDMIKKHIVEDGAIPSLTVANVMDYYNYDRTNPNASVFNSTAYNCNNTNETRDHAVTIVGWDDNYSKDNFAEGAKPSTDGAYIVLNSYGDQIFDNGYIYISYEDYFIETELYSIVSTTKKDYDNVYQSDFYGGIFAIGTQSVDTGYYANTFKKENKETEYIDSVGITVCDYVTLEIYVNPNGDSKDFDSLVKVSETTGILEPGYHRIQVTPTKIEGEEFTIVIKQKSTTGNKFYFSLEAPVENTAYEYVTSENTGAYSVDGNYWLDLTSLNISEFDINKSDVCIKAFTTVEDEENMNKPETPPEDVKPDDTEKDDNDKTEPDDTNKYENEKHEEKPEDDEKESIITSKEYEIKEREIYKITFNTKIKDFKSKIQTNSEISIYDNKNEITNEDELIKTGMTIKMSDGKEYTLIVRGDLNCDGKITLTDLSKMVLHYNENEGYILEGATAKAADMNFDNKSTITDVSQLLVLYNSL